MNDYLDRLKEFAATLENGRVEFVVTERRERQVNIIGVCRYENIPTLQKAYELFGPTKLAIMVRPHFDGNWAVSMVSLR